MGGSRSGVEREPPSLTKVQKRRFSVAERTGLEMQVTQFWRANIRHGAEAVGFHHLQTVDGEALTAHLVVPAYQMAPSVLRSALALIELHREIDRDPSLATLLPLRDTLRRMIGGYTSYAALAAYRSALADEMWTRVASDPASLIDAWAARRRP